MLAGGHQGFIGPPQAQPMQQGPRPGGEAVASEPKLFVGQIPLEATQTDLLNLFARHGTVKSSVIITGPDGRSKGCAKVLFERWSEAERALECENGTCNLGGSKPMVVKFADPPKRGGPDGAQGGIAPKKLFIGQVPAQTTEAELRALFAPYGNIAELHLLKKNPGAGCAFVTYDRWSEAETAMDAHNGKTQLEGAKAPLVVKFADAGTSVPGSQKRGFGDVNGFPGMAPMAMGMPGPAMPGMPGMGGPKKQFNGGYGYPPGGMYGMVGMGGMGYGGAMMGPMGMGMGMAPQGMGMGMPAGGMGMGGGMPSRTGSSAGGPSTGPSSGSMTNNRLGSGIVDETARQWKLFVGQVPFEAHERDLWPIFSGIGPILELVVLRSGGKSRGCAFVTYENRMLAEKAIRQLDGQVFVPSDPRQRLLIVKYAGAGSPGGSGSAGPSPAGPQDPQGMALQQQQQMQMQMAAMQQQQQMQQMQMQMAMQQQQLGQQQAAQPDGYSAQPMQMAVGYGYGQPAFATQQF